jgi:RHS repeat-associated protein
VGWYWHADWLGSVRFASTPTQTMYYDAGIASYGEHYVETGTTKGVFAGMVQNTITGMYDTPNREYDTTSGRWLSPDRAGLAAADPSNPQSWNRYAYVLNNPTTLVDPLGLYSYRVGNCLFDTAYFYVNGDYKGSDTIFEGCYGGGPYSGGGQGLGSGGGGGGSSSNGSNANAGRHNGTDGSNTTVCSGPSQFTAVGPEQALGQGALSFYGIPGHQSGGVAVNPAVFGIQVGTKGATAALSGFAFNSAIIPQDLRTSGFPGPPYKVTDIGDENVLSNMPFQFDLYGAPHGLPTTEEAYQFGRQPTTAFVVVNDPNFACPSGYRRY